MQKRHRSIFSTHLTVLLVHLVLPACLFINASQLLAGQAAKNNLEVMDVTIDPIGQGKNVVHVEVRNPTSRKQVFAIHIYTRSPDFGQRGVGWGTAFFESLAPQEIRKLRFAYKIQGPVTKNTWVRLKFYNPESEEAFDYKKNFQESKYVSSDLPKRPLIQDTRQALTEKSAIVMEAFAQIQTFIRSKQYKEAWALFTRDYQQVEFQRTRFDERFAKAMNEPSSMLGIFTWNSKEFLELQPKSVVERGGILVLTAARGNEIWKAELVQDAGRWKLDWMSGFTPGWMARQKWEKKLHSDSKEHQFEDMQRRVTPHFDIYYFKDSTAAREIEQVVKEREAGFQKICDFLNKPSDVRIRLVLFEDRKTKLAVTGHDGMGWATGNAMVEVYGTLSRINPYHETTHVLMR